MEPEIEFVDHETCFQLIKQTFHEEDENIFEKLIELSKMNVSTKQFGGDENYSIPLTASIVELSMIDNYPSPEEKLRCICSAYDLVYAELKSAMIQIISQNTEKEHEIPVIDTKDIVPVLKMILIRSKLRHAFSNMYFIINYSKHDEVSSKIVENFKNAIEQLAYINYARMARNVSKIKLELPVLEYMAITAERNQIPIDEKRLKSIIDAENDRIFNLISKSTEEPSDFM